MSKMIQGIEQHDATVILINTCSNDRLQLHSDVQIISRTV